MSTFIKNFVALTHQSSDLLTPIEYRTIVEMIQGILSSYDFRRLDGALKRLYVHLTDFNDPHKVADLSFFNEIVERTYAIYTNMTATPLSLVDFKAQVSSTVAFVELIRRIVLNRYLYDQVKNPDGSVPESATVFLSDDWGLSERDPNPLVLVFGTGIDSEEKFIRLGWNGNSTPVGAIFTADFLSSQKKSLAVVFNTSADAPNTVRGGNGKNLPNPINLSSNDLTVDVEFAGNPKDTTSLLSLENGTDQIEMSVDVEKKITVSLNNKTLFKTASPSSDGKILLVIDKKGTISLQSKDRAVLATNDSRFVFRDDAPLNSATVIAPYRSLFTSTFGLNNLTIYRAYDPDSVADTIVIPPGYQLLIEENGSYFCDSDGAPLMDLGIDISAGDLDDYIFYVDRDGSYVVDRDGAFMVSFSFKIPEGFLILVDDDGKILKDDNGDYLVEFDFDLLPTGYTLVIDEAGRVVTDDKGAYLITNFVPDGYSIVVNPQGEPITNQWDGYLIAKDK